jgi:hypothetical protein
MNCETREATLQKFPLSPWVMNAKRYEHGLPLAAMFTAVVVFFFEPVFELPPQAVTSSAAVATTIGTAKLRRRSLIDWIPPIGEPLFAKSVLLPRRAPRACAARLLRGAGPTPSVRRPAPAHIGTLQHCRRLGGQWVAPGSFGEAHLQDKRGGLADASLLVLSLRARPYQTD